MELYLWHMVLVLRECYRVLREDGTLYLNLGDTYASGSQRATPYGTYDKGLLDSHETDSACSHLCDGCLAVSQSAGIVRNGPLRHKDVSLDGQRGHDSEHQDCAGGAFDVGVPGVPGSTKKQSLPQPLAACSHCANCGACLAVLRSSSRDARLCVRRTAAQSGPGVISPDFPLYAHSQESRNGTEETADALAGHISDTVSDFSYRDYTINSHHMPSKNILPQGNLLGIPWRVALTAQADSWILRRDVIWEKVSPMPESVNGWRFQGETCPCVAYPDQKPALVLEQGTARLNSHVGVQNNPAGLALPTCDDCHGTGRLDTLTLRRGSWRHTASHEYVFMLVKQMGYYANAEAVREEHQASSLARASILKNGTVGEGKRADPGTYASAFTDYHLNPGGRNPRDVIRPAPSAYAGAHFAVFPPSLPEQLLRASCPERVCTACGEPWAPIVNTQFQPSSLDARGRVKGLDASNGWNGFPRGSTSATTHGLAPTCPCPDDTPWRPGVCLDCFSGTGTVSLVARALGRNSIGVEASPAYLKLARERLSLNLLDASEGKPIPAREETYTDLPLFT